MFSVEEEERDDDHDVASRWTDERVPGNLDGVGARSDRILTAIQPSASERDALSGGANGRNGQFAPSRQPSRIDAATPRSIALIEGAVFLRDCISRNLTEAFAFRVKCFASGDEFRAHADAQDFHLILFSASNLSNEIVFKEVALLASHVSAPIIVLAHQPTPESARAALGCGAKGFIPMATGFELAVQVVRFVSAGGTYLPAECLLAERSGGQQQSLTPASVVTSRELAVVRGIREGKPNKIIAYELNMCESTVKVHVRHIMKKLRARNRTDIAVKSAELLESPVG